MESDKSPNVPHSFAALTLALLSRSILTMSLWPRLEAQIKAVSPVLANDNRTTENKKKKANVRSNTQQHDNKDTVPTTQKPQHNIGSEFNTENNVFKGTEGGKQANTQGQIQRKFQLILRGRGG